MTAKQNPGFDSRVSGRVHGDFYLSWKIDARESTWICLKNSDVDDTLQASYIPQQTGSTVNHANDSIIHEPIIVLLCLEEVFLGLVPLTWKRSSCRWTGRLIDAWVANPACFLNKGKKRNKPWARCQKGKLKNELAPSNHAGRVKRDWPYKVLQPNKRYETTYKRKSS